MLAPPKTPAAIVNRDRNKVVAEQSAACIDAGKCLAHAEFHLRAGLCEPAGERPGNGYGDRTSRLGLRSIGRSRARHRADKRSGKGRRPPRRAADAHGTPVPETDRSDHGIWLYLPSFQTYQT